MRRLDGELRTALRDAVHRPSRKPFAWGGLAGYRQLEAIAQALHQMPPLEGETDYVQRMVRQVDRVVEMYRTQAHDLAEAQGWLRRIAACLRYPPPPSVALPGSGTSRPNAPSGGTGQQVQGEMETLLASFQPDLQRQPAQAALYHAWHRLWKTWGPELLPCYDIPGLPPDNLKLEGLFGRLRNHQRRLSGRQSTRELRELGAYQVLVRAESEAALLAQLRQVPLEVYDHQRYQLAEAEAPRQFLGRLHRDPVDTMQQWVNQHTACRKGGSGETAGPASGTREERRPGRHPTPRAGPPFSEPYQREEMRGNRPLSSTIDLDVSTSSQNAREEVQ